MLFVITAFEVKFPSSGASFLHLHENVECRISQLVNDLVVKKGIPNAREVFVTGCHVTSLPVIQRRVFLSPCHNISPPVNRWKVAASIAGPDAWTRRDAESAFPAHPKNAEYLPGWPADNNRRRQKS